MIGPKNTNLVEDVEILLSVQLRWILCSGFKGEVENVLAYQRPGRPSCFSDQPEKHKLGRGRWDFASLQVSLYISNDENLKYFDLFSLDFENNIPKLTDDQRERLESPITSMEILAALKKLKNGKSPGTSGFQTDFFKFFWNDIGPFVAMSFNCRYSKTWTFLVNSSILVIIFFSWWKLYWLI